MWYNLTLTPDYNDTWLVSSSDFAELVSFGETQEDERRHGRDALARGAVIPDASDEPKGKGSWVQLSALVALKVALYNELWARDMTRADLMRPTGWHREQVDRLFRLEHATRLDIMADAFKAIGVALSFQTNVLKAA